MTLAEKAKRYEDLKRETEYAALELQHAIAEEAKKSAETVCHQQISLS